MSEVRWGEWRDQADGSLVRFGCEVTPVPDQRGVFDLRYWYQVRTPADEDEAPS